MRHDLFDEKEHLFMSNELAHKAGRLLNLLNEYEIDVWLLKYFDYETYCRIRTKALEGNVDKVEDSDIPAIPLPTKEQFNFIKGELESL